MKNLDEKFSEDSNLEELAELENQVEMILNEELKKSSIIYDRAISKVHDVKSVGVQGDKRTYARPAEIAVYLKGKIVWDTEFLSNLSTRITNEVTGINRVAYLFEPN